MPDSAFTSIIAGLMNISSFDDLLKAAETQPEPQRLLLVFAEAELLADASEVERARFQSGIGGALVPKMCVDKLPGELLSFEALVEESRNTGCAWTIVFVAGMSGQGGRAPTSIEAEPVLQRMVESIKTGSFGGFVPFDRDGDPVRFQT